MECKNITLNKEYATHVYKGETIIFEGTIRDEDGNIITSVDDIVILLTDLTDKKDPIERRLNDGIEFDQGNIRFVILPEESNELPNRCGIEIKIIINGIVRIATRQLMTVVDNKVKDY